MNNIGVYEKCLADIIMRGYELRAMLCGAELRYSPMQPRNAKGMWCKEGVGGSTNSSESVDKSAESGIMKSSEDFSYISANGPNEFERGFSHSNLVNHWYGLEKSHSHKDEYIKENPQFTMEMYADRALDLVQSPTSKRILGYKTQDGYVIRYDTKRNDFVKGNPHRGIKTMFKPKRGLKYFMDQMLDEGVGNDET